MRGSECDIRPGTIRMLTLTVQGVPMKNYTPMLSIDLISQTQTALSNSNRKLLNNDNHVRRRNSYNPDNHNEIVKKSEKCNHYT